MSMEAKVSSNPLPLDPGAYVAQRLATPRVLLLLAFIVAATWLVAPPADAVRALQAGVAAMLLVVQLRIADDLADRAHDAVAHSDRVLPRAMPGPYRWLVAALTLPIAALLGARSWALLVGYAALGVGLVAVYRTTRSAGTARSALLLLKYPAIVLLAAGTAAGGQAPWVALGVYALLLLHELTGRERAMPQRHPRRLAPAPECFESRSCYACGSSDARPFVTAEEDLTGKPGRFTFVQCNACGLAYQSPRLAMACIGAYYDDEYIAHRKKKDWGVLTPFYARAMDKHDRDKLALVQGYCALGAESEVLDVGCAAGTFLAKVRAVCGSRVTGVDFKDLSHQPWLREADFRCGLFYEQDFGARRFDLVTMWHFLEHDYDPPRSLRTARELLAPGGRLVIEVPRLDSATFALYGDRWPGLQAPQHTVLFDRERLLAMVRAAGLEVEAYLPYGAFPAYFYLFAGLAFKLLKGRGLDLDRAILPYFAGQLLLWPLLAFERHLNLAMQTVVCRRAEG